MGLTEPAVRLAAENEILRRLFSDHLIIVDEAHNLRDSSDGSASSGSVSDSAAGAGDAAENLGGKSLNPYLRRIVMNAEGLRLVLMTATPMYNSVTEIVLLLNYLIMNDTKTEKSQLKVSDLFMRDGELVGGPSQKLLERYARRYVSYMRGENPFTFPLRMRPAAAADDVASLWPTVSASKRPVDLTEQDRATINAMPFVFTEPIAGSVVERLLYTATKTAHGGDDEVVTSDSMLDLRMQMANISYPNEMYGTQGWDGHFASSHATISNKKMRLFAPKKDVDAIFAGEGLATCAPKIARIVESVRRALGISFVYSRYIKAGALPLAIALERAGFQRRLADGKRQPLLVGVPPPPPICAICGEHHGLNERPDHPFRAASYILLTSDDEISPNFPGLIRRATSWPEDREWGPLGSEVKVIIGSQVASEGLDLKCIREMHILDAWYHLNRTDQIIGRAIRYCSHAALRSVEERMELPPMALNNCLIYLHALRINEFETADMYAYRIAIGKAQAIGKVQRLLKKHAWDCNLEIEAIVFAGLPTRMQMDAQGRRLEEYSINDQDFTSYCDYQTCRHECAVATTWPIDSSTFSASDARRIILEKQQAVRRLFDLGDGVWAEKVVQDLFDDLPWEIRSEALMELLDPRRFRLRRDKGRVEGFLVKKNGYLVFQPIKIKDTNIPIALRYARAFQLRRRFITTAFPKQIRKAALSTAFAQWIEWEAFVTGGAPFPAFVNENYRLWEWFLTRYAALPSIRLIALRWWFDKLIGYDDQRKLLETVTFTDEYPSLNAILRVDVLKGQAFRIYNPTSQAIEFWCKEDEGELEQCSSDFIKSRTLSDAIGVRPVNINTEIGNLVGFLTSKLTGLVFKTLDTTRTGDKKLRLFGAECGNTSTLGEHYPRIHLLHVAGSKVPALAPLMLPDSSDLWNLTMRRPAERPEHVKDMTHQPLCLYMEVLSRIIDAEHVSGKRWFLSAVEAHASGLKSKKKGAKGE
jgi:hypothetical protein